MNQILQLNNGLRLAYTYDPHVRSVCWGVFVRAGSRDESAADNGISHLIEHMCFKGTERRSAFDIVRDADMLGADLNAFTSKEMTAYYIHSLDSNVEAACDILADIVLHHTFDPVELEKEKQVVLEEIDQYEDSPDDVVSDLAATAYWGQDALARPVLGTKENVLRFSRQDLFDYEHRWYVAGNVVLSVVGNIDLTQAIRIAETYFTFPAGSVQHTYPDIPLTPTQCSRVKDIEQSNILLTFPGVERFHPSLSALMVFDSILGGGMSSILFQRVREQEGLAYSVCSYPVQYMGRGAFCISLATNPAKLDKALATVADVIAELRRDGLTDAQLARGVQQVKSMFVFGLESNMSCMRAQARWLLLADRAFDVDQQIAALDRVTQRDVRDIIDLLFSRAPAIGVVAKEVADYTGYFHG